MILIGFNKKILTSSVNVGDYIPNLSQDREILNVHCDLISPTVLSMVMNRNGYYI